MKKFSIILGAIILALFVTLVIWGVYCDNTIAITNYCVNNTKNDAKLKFVVITDLHNKEYGEKNADLAELVKEQNPDFIAVCGDMVNRGDPDTTKMKDVLEKLSKIAPTYCCLGNHERDNAAKFGTDFKSETNSTGAVLLDNEYIKFTKNGKSVLIGGMSDYPYYEFYTPDDDVPSRTLWEEFAEKAKNNFTILLHHQPEYIAEDAKLKADDAALAKYFSDNMGTEDYSTYEEHFGRPYVSMVVLSELANNYLMDNAVNA